MSITASIAMSSATVTSGAKSTATVTITNASATAVTVSAVNGFASPTGTTKNAVGVLVGQCTAGRQGFSVSVPGSNGTATMTFDVVPEAPWTGVYGANPFPSGVTPMVPLAMPAQQVLDIGANCLVSDGSSCIATTATLTVNGPTR